MSVHTYPLNDLREHDLETTECSCDPYIEYVDEDIGLPYEDGPLVVHNSWDGREIMEWQPEQEE